MFSLGGWFSAFGPIQELLTEQQVMGICGLQQAEETILEGFVQQVCHRVVAERGRRISRRRHCSSLRVSKKLKVARQRNSTRLQEISEVILKVCSLSVIRYELNYSFSFFSIVMLYFIICV